MISAATVLERKLVALVEREGAVTFRDFMQAALYDAEHGYYNTERLKIGPEGDYYTSSNTHPAFGAVLARAFLEMWGDLGCAASEPFTIVEMGAGTGQLARDILTTLSDEHPAVFETMSYVILELSQAMLARQRERLDGFNERIRWLEFEDIEREPITGIFFSNELVDAMPVHRVRIASGGIEELFVVVRPRSELEPARLALKWDRPSKATLQEYVERAGARLALAQVIEINLDAINWLHRLSQAIHKGFLVTIDYGDQASHLYAADRARGTLRSFYKHRLVDSPLERVGEQDITASVSFTALIDYGRDFGFKTVSYERQTAFLLRMGLIERIAAMEDATGSVDNLKQRLAVKNLFVPGGVSDNFRVLIQRK
jgi:SAM-dependent MidA family methyltransferase